MMSVEMISRNTHCNFVLTHNTCACVENPAEWAAKVDFCWEIMPLETNTHILPSGVKISNLFGLISV